MRKIIQIAIFSVLSTFSLGVFAECSIELPFDELSDCIVVEGAGGNYINQRDHIPALKAVQVMDQPHANAIDKFIRASSKETK